jgi:hypothetical protein
VDSTLNMKPALHITSGDMAGSALAKSGVPGEVFVWHDILYDGPRQPGWPDDETLQARARFIEDETGGGLSREFVYETLANQYARLAAAGDCAACVLWFDACLFDQSMLAHILTCLAINGVKDAELLCVDAFPGIDPYDGLGQLTPAQLASVYEQRRPVTEAQWRYAEKADRAFALQDQVLFDELARQHNAPLPWVPAAVRRWLQEQPDPVTGLGRLEALALRAVRGGATTPAEIMAAAAAADTHPLYWGDIMLWAKINRLADRDPSLVIIDGPLPRLPQWEGIADLTRFRITPAAST